MRPQNRSTARSQTIYLVLELSLKNSFKNPPLSSVKLIMLFVLLSFSPPVKTHARSLSRSMSDPSRYVKVFYSEDGLSFDEDKVGNAKAAEETTNGNEEDPWLLRERSSPK